MSDWRQAEEHEQQEWEAAEALEYEEWLDMLESEKAIIEEEHPSLELALERQEYLEDR